MLTSYVLGTPQARPGRGACSPLVADAVGIEVERQAREPGEAGQALPEACGGPPRLGAQLRAQE
eukprot:13760579-Heterocapsa_arctica.AAC.1